MGELIRVTQLPVIEEELRAMKASVEEAVANAKALACTPETIQTLKAVRTELRKRFDELERQRIAVKRAVMGPYDAFEVVYKECVSVLYQEADADLKKKIFATESSIKLACEDRLRTYYSELCAVHRVNFVPFEKAGITVDTLRRRGWALSCTEVGLSGYATEGTLFSYFSDNAKRVAYLDETTVAVSWGLRSPYSDSGNAYNVNTDGTPNHNSVYFPRFAARPAFNLLSSIVVSNTTDGDGCYTVEDTPAGAGGLYAKNNGIWVRV